MVVKNDAATEKILVFSVQLLLLRLARLLLWFFSLTTSLLIPFCIQLLVSPKVNKDLRKSADA
jgi:hypothetical protein